MNLLKQREPLLAAMVVLLVVAVGLKEPAFLSADSLANVVTDSTLLVMLALTQMLVIVTRGVDLSVAYLARSAAGGDFSERGFVLSFGVGVRP